MQFDHAVLFSNYPEAINDVHVKWLRKRSKLRIRLKAAPLRSPTHREDIYLAVSETLETLEHECAGSELCLAFHTSPGTGPMAAIWMILARSRFPAELLTSSIEHGVSKLEAPFPPR